MDNASSFVTNVKVALSALLNDILAFLPSLAGAILLLVGGWLLARLLRTVAAKLCGLSNRVMDAIVPTGRLSSIRLSGRMTGIIGDVVYWLVIFFALTAASKVTGFDALAGWLDGIVGYLPVLLGSASIILVGYIIGLAIRDLVSSAFATAGAARSDLIGATVQWGIVATSVVIGAGQLGIDVTFLIVIAAIVLSTLLGGLALAFGLGAKSLATNLIGVHYLKRQYTLGQKLQIGETVGNVLAFNAAGLVLDTKQGRTTVPGDVYFKERITLYDIQESASHD